MKLQHGARARAGVPRVALQIGRRQLPKGAGESWMRTQTCYFSSRAWSIVCSCVTFRSVLFIWSRDWRATSSTPLMSTTGTRTRSRPCTRVDRSFVASSRLAVLCCWLSLLLRFCSRRLARWPSCHVNASAAGRNCVASTSRSLRPCSSWQLSSSACWWWPGRSWTPASLVNFMWFPSQRWSSCHSGCWGSCSPDAYRACSFGHAGQSPQ
mmetsp:Transcript_42533/g.87461  ORF Transcript_42533/g.87461 Transcript_42533/m.87461 type:complete len:210 (+) Transcript_42533:514-1143(+)